MSMLRVSKIVPPKRQIIKDISLSFFPGAKIGLLGLNGSGKSTVLRIMALQDKEYDGEAEQTIETFSMDDAVCHDAHGVGRVVGVETSAVTVEFRGQPIRITSPYRKLFKL